MVSYFASTRVDEVVLRVKDQGGVGRFYQDIMGLREIGRTPGLIRFSATGEEPALLVLQGDSAAKPRRHTSPGLFHIAFLFPGRKELARTVRHIAERQWRFHGFADHGVSEAIYLSDPEGNGLELYRDRPSEQWPRNGKRIGMVTAQLDVRGLVDEVSGQQRYDSVHPETMIGHIHLQVSQLDRSALFYHGVLGLDVTQEDYPGALFLSADGYHHHIGLNIWNSSGSAPAPEYSAGLLSFRLRFPRGRIADILSKARSLKPG
ncbi:MAG: VOC family protein, partial [Ignavibacteriales bacterium]|nr:VOC family protein [Ignavibacteriales bacterium]